MPELEPEDITSTELLTPPFAPRKAVEREGLPPGYRMRADAHYVDQLSTRSPEVPMRLLATAEIDAPDLATVVDAASLTALSQSIAAHGMVQPLLVRRDGSRHRLIAGRRRLAAARAAGVARVPCLVYAVDEAHAAALAAAADVRADAPPVRPSPGRGASIAADVDVLGRVADAIATIQSATGLVAGDGSALVRRVALDLIRAAAWRAAWDVRAAAILADRHRWRMQPRLLGLTLQRVRDGFAADARLKGVDVRLRVDDWNASADVDEDALVAAVSGAVLATAELTDGEAPQIAVVLRADEDVPAIEISQSAATADEEARAAFDRHAGARVARIVAERHGGGAALVAVTPRGSTVRLTLAPASMATPASTKRKPQA